MLFDLERLKEAADCRSVAEFIGMRLNGRYCECVSGTHSETKLNHCTIRKMGTYCFSCGDKRDVFGMVRGYYQNVLGTPISTRQVFEIVGNACGGAELYITDGSLPAKESAARPERFSRDELTMLGLLEGPCLALRDDVLLKQIVKERCEEVLDKLENLHYTSLPDSVGLYSAIEMRKLQVKQLLVRCGGNPNARFVF